MMRPSHLGPIIQAPNPNNTKNHGNSKPPSVSNPFEQYFYSHLRNVTVSLKDLNQSILRSHRNLFSGRKKNNRVQVTCFQEEELHPRKNWRSHLKISFPSKQNLKYLILLGILWMVGFCYFSMWKQTPDKLDSQVMSATEWRALQESAPFKYDYTWSLPTDDLDFEGYCDFLEMYWLKKHNPYYSFLISPFLNSFNNQSIRDQTNGSSFLGIFSENHTFLSFNVYHNHTSTLTLRVVYITFNLDYLNQLSLKYLNKQLPISSPQSTHFYFQQDKQLIKILQNAIQKYYRQ